MKIMYYPKNIMEEAIKQFFPPVIVEEIENLMDDKHFHQIPLPNGKICKDFYYHDISDEAFFIKDVNSKDYHKIRILNDYLAESGINALNSKMRELAEIEKEKCAKKLKWEEYEEDCVFYSDDFYCSLDDFLDDYCGNLFDWDGCDTFEQFYDEVPKYVNAAKKKQMYRGWHLDDVLDNGDHYNDYIEEYDHRKSPGYDEFKAAYEKFLEDNKENCYWQETNDLVEIPKEMWEEKWKEQQSLFDGVDYKYEDFDI